MLKDKLDVTRVKDWIIWKGFAPIKDGVELVRSHSMELAKRDWDPQDPGQNIDFSRHIYWLVSDNGLKKGFDTIAEALESIL